MPDPVHGYIPQGNATPFRWVPAVHETDGTRVLLYRFHPPENPARAAQLQKLLGDIPDLGSPILLAPHDYNCLSQTPFCCVLKKDLHPLRLDDAVSMLSDLQTDQLILNLARGLDLLHQRGLLMGMLTPDCLLTRQPLTPDSVLLAGFAHMLDTAGLPDMPLKGYDTPYTAPELLAYTQAPSADLARLLSPACDVFSLGILFHELLIGVRPTCTPASIARQELPQLSRKLDYPHRQLLRRMLHPDPAERLPDMISVSKELSRLIAGNGCTIQVKLPALAGQMITVRMSDGSHTRKRLGSDGCAAFGPLLADETYELICKGKELGKIRFPKNVRDQVATFGETCLQGLRPVYTGGPADDAPTKPAPLQPGNPPAPEKPAEPCPEAKAAPAAKPEPLQIRQPAVPEIRRIPVEPPLNNIILIEVLSPELCQLTLINYGSFRIRTVDAHRYGISHLIRNEGR